MAVYFKYAKLKQLGHQWKASTVKAHHVNLVLQKVQIYHYSNITRTSCVTKCLSCSQLFKLLFVKSKSLTRCCCDRKSWYMWFTFWNIGNGGTQNELRSCESLECLLSDSSEFFILHLTHLTHFPSAKYLQNLRNVV